MSRQNKKEKLRYTRAKIDEAIRRISNEDPDSPTSVLRAWELFRGIACNNGLPDPGPLDPEILFRGSRRQKSGKR